MVSHTGMPVDIRTASLRAIAVLVRRDLIRWWRDRSRLIGSMGGPMLFLIVLGTGFGSTLRGVGGDWAHLSYPQFMFPGILAMVVLFNAAFGSMSIVADREFGFLREVLVAPVSRSAVAIGKALGTAIQASIQSLVVVVIAPFVGIHLTPQMVVEVVPVAFVLAYAIAGLGTAIASRMTSMQGFQFLSSFLIQPMFFLSGALFPITGLPGWLAVLTRFDPVAYGVDPLRRVVLESSGVPQPTIDAFTLTIFGFRPSIGLELALLLCFGAITTAFAAAMFRRQP